MRRVPYKSVIAKVAGLLKGQATLSAEEDALANVFVNQKAGEFWEGTFWPEWTVSEKRYFRRPFDPTRTYAAAEETYDARTDAYYQALRSPSMGNTVTNAVGLVATLTLPVAHGLTAGTTLWITVSGISTAAFNGTWLATASSTADVVYTMTSAPGGGPFATGTVMLHPSADVKAFWAASADAYSGDDWKSGAAYVVGDVKRELVSGRFYQCYVAHTSAATLDLTKFAILTEFKRTIDFTQAWATTVIGDVKEVWDADPNTTERSERCEISFDLLNGAVVVRGTETVVWVEFRLTVPSWTGDDISMSATYGTGDQAYDDTQGDFYISLQSANTGHAVTDAAWWARIDFPYDLRDCVALACYGEMLQADGEGDQAVVMAAKASRLWKAAVDRYERQQDQAGQMRVKGR